MPFILKVSPELRPSATRGKHHLFLKTMSNPFTKHFYDTLKNMSRGFNPFNKEENEIDPIVKEDVNCSVEPSDNEGIHPLFLYLV